MLGSTSGSFDQNDYGRNSFTKIVKEKIHSYYVIDDNDDNNPEENLDSENETGTNEMNFFKSERSYSFGLAECSSFSTMWTSMFM